MLFFDTCAVCDRPGRPVCLGCQLTVLQAQVPPAPDCPFRVVGLFAYADEGKKMIGRVKQQGRRSPLGWIARELAAQFDGRSFDAVTWVPSSHQGRRERGYEPSHVLARRIAKELHLPNLRLLRRRDREHQSTRSRTDRLDGPDLEAALHARVPRRLLLVDDVCTTGASLRAAARVLLSAGAQDLAVAVAAITPRANNVAA